MADSLSKDVVGARINLDTSKILPAFKVIDGGASKNAASFKALNAELGVTAKNYADMAKAMDKTALSSEERRKKILAESNALVEQRKASAELLTAKKQQLDQTNQIVDSKLAAQLALQQKREAAIEQQEREHLKRMATLDQKSAQSSTQANLVQARLDRTLQLTQSGDKKLEMEAERHAARMEALNRAAMNPSTSVDTSSQNNFIDYLGRAASRALVFHTVYAGLREVQEALKTGIVDIESNMAGYVQTNEHYFLEWNEGTKEMTMNTEKLHAETSKFLHTAHELGAEITDVTESARLWGRMYKDVNVVQELVRQSTKLSTVDMVGLEDATKSMESVMAQYGVHIESSNDAMVVGNRVLDSWSKTAHDTMAPARDLGAAFERTGKIAAETGVGFDMMNGLISAGIRNTALSGENLGNMWKTVLGTIRTDKAVAEIERLGVETTKVVDGVTEWKKAEDILLDLSIKVIDKNYDLTQSYADISRGVYQFAKLAASLNAGDILLGSAASIGSTGSTMEYLKVQMDTIQRKAAQAKTSLMEIFNTAGDDGLRRMIKDALDVLDQFLIGLSKVPTGVYGVTASLAGLMLAYKALRQPIMSMVTAMGVLTGAKTAETVATTASTAANQVNIVSSRGVTLSTVQMGAAAGTGAAAQGGLAAATGVATAAMTAEAAIMTVVTGGLVLLGAALAGVVYVMGNASKADRDHIQDLKDKDSVAQQLISQYERQAELLPKLANAHNELERAYNSGTLAADKQTQIKRQLDQISQALTITLGEEGAAQLEAANYSDKAVQIQVDALNKATAAQRESRQNVLIDQQTELMNKQIKKKEELEAATKKLAIAEMLADGVTADTEAGLKYLAKLELAQKAVHDLSKENNTLTDSLAEVNIQMAQLAVTAADELAGSAGKATESTKDQEEALAALRDEITNNSSAISELNQIQKQLRDGQSLNAETVTDLILRYPELTSHIYKTADGWGIEKDAVELLRKAKIQKAIDDVESEQKSSNATRLETAGRLKAYGIEMKGIKDLADFKARMNGLDKKHAEGKKSLFELDQPFEDPFGYGIDPTSRLKEAAKAQLKDDEATYKEIQGIYNEYAESMGDYDEKLKKLTELYNDPGFGVNGSKSDKKKDDSGKKKEDPLKTAFEASEKWIAHQKAIGKLTNQQELEAWQRVQSTYAVGTEWRKKADEKVYALKQTLIQEAAKKEQEAFNQSMSWLSHQKGIREVSTSEELAAIQRLQSRYKQGTDERMKLDEQAYSLKKKLIEDEAKKAQESLSKSESWISHEKAMGRMSVEEELKAWERIQARYREGTAERKRADEQVYALKKSLISSEEKAVTSLIEKQRSGFEEAKKTAVKQIEDEKTAFIAAQDAKIKAIDELIAKMNEANEDDDYETKLNEKLARLQVLESAVGPEGLKERKQVNKDIADMQLEHERTLAKRELEAQKKGLQDEKAQKEQDYKDQIAALEAHYDDLIAAFDAFKDDTANKAELLKQIQILKESEKNTAILNQLDQFIADYQSKMSAIGTLSMTKAQIDLLEYNNNKDAWDAAKASGNQAEMARLSARNQEIRTEYGIAKDTGKLQHFSDGGRVQGLKGAAVPVIAHAGEIILNEPQQQNLFKLLNFAMPQLSFTTPNFAMAAGGESIVQNYYTADVSTGNVTIEDGTAAKVFWNERDNVVRRFQTRSGAKQR